jgi:hypothetical protein
MAENELLAAALLYASYGWKVFPCHTIRGGRCSCGVDCASPGKHPLVQGGVYAATGSAAQIATWWARWPDANIGVATGMASGFIALDIDEKHGGFESLADLEGQFGKLVNTPSCSKTGGGGKHILFRHPGVQIQNKVNIAPGLDVRGDGGYIIAPPSRHASGNRYEWIAEKADE